MPQTEILFDDFTRPDGPIGNGWADASTLNGTFTDVVGQLVGRPGMPEVGEPAVPPTRYTSTSTGAPLEIQVRPNAFSAPKIVANTAVFQPTATNTLRYDGAYGGSRMVGHFLLYRSLGATDNIELTIQWQCPELWAAVQQVSPVAFVDPLAANPTRLGLLPVFDVSIGGGVNYLQNAYRNPENLVLAPQVYKVLGLDGLFHSAAGPMENGPQPPNGPNPPFGSANTPIPLSGPGIVHTSTLRVKGGFAASYVDNNATPLVGPLPVPPELQGRDGWGMHVIAQHPDPTLFPQDPDWPDHDVPSRIDWWRAKTFTGNWTDPIT